MKFLSLLALLIIVPCTHAQQAGSNAALQYWQAFATVPNLSDDDASKLKQWATIEISDEIRRASAKSTAWLRYLEKGARAEHCDWDIDWESGFGALLPHLGKARQLAMIAGLRARIALIDGRDTEAVDQLMAGWALGRHIGRDGSLISLLVQIAIESMYMEFLAENLGAFEPAALSRLQDKMAALPVGSDFVSALKAEQQMLKDSVSRPYRLMRERFSDEEIETLLGVLAAFAAESTPGPDQVMAMRSVVEKLDAAHYRQVRTVLPLPEDQDAALALFEKFAGVLRNETVFNMESAVPLYLGAKGVEGKPDLEKQLKEFDALYAELIALAGGPVAGFVAAYPAFEKKVQASNPVVQMIFPNFGASYKRAKQFEERAAMLKAAIAHRLDAAKAKAAWAERFDWEEQPGDALRLRSKVTFDGKPVELTFKLRPPKPSTAVSTYATPLPDQEKVRKALKEMRRLATVEPGSDDHQKMRKEIGKHLGNLAAGLEGFEISEQDGLAVVDELLVGLRQFAGDWLAIVEQGADQAGSAQSATTILLHIGKLEIPAILWSFRDRRDAIEKLIGPKRTGRMISTLELARSGLGP